MEDEPGRRTGPVLKTVGTARCGVQVLRLPLMRVLICGSRDFHDIQAIQIVVDNLDTNDIIVHGCARGADTIAGWLAKRRGLTILEFPAQWNKYGKAAGPIRNKQMLDEGKPDKVFAFYTDKKKSRGTANMVKQAKAAGIPVWENQ